MPFATAADGVKLYYEECGTGRPVVFVHEYAGDFRNWEPQLRQLSRQYRCVTFSARGYPPSGVPTDGTNYSQEIARMFQEEGIEAAAAKYADFPMRSQYKAKDPRGWQEFKRWLGEHSAEGHALTMLHVQLRRPTLPDMEPRLRALRVPTLVIAGDEDAACIDGSLMLKRTVPGAALMVMPRAGHTINSEEPAAFNQALLEFFGAVENRRWMAHRQMALD